MEADEPEIAVCKIANTTEKTIHLSPP